MLLLSKPSCLAKFVRMDINFLTTDRCCSSSSSLVDRLVFCLVFTKLSNIHTSLYKTKTSVKTRQVISVSSHGVLRYSVFPSFKISIPAELINIHCSALEEQQVLLYELWTLKLKIFWLSGLP